MIYSAYQKPLVGSQINWKHPLSKGLICCVIGNVGSGSAITDIVDNRLCPFNNTTYNTMRNGVVFVSATNTYVDIYSGKLKKGGGSFSTEILFLTDAYLSRCVFAFEAASSSYRHALFGLGSASWLWRIRNVGGSSTSDLNMTPIPPTGAWNHIILTWNGVSQTAYLNGLPYVSRTGVFSGLVGLENCTVIRFGGATDVAVANTSVQLFRHYTKALTDNEVLRLYKEPYAMFEQRPVWMDYTAPPVAGEYRMIYHNHYQQMRMV